MNNKINIDITKLDDVLCSNCNKKDFEHFYRLKILPALMSNSGKEEVIVLQVYACTNCGKELRRDNANIPK